MAKAYPLLKYYSIIYILSNFMDSGLKAPVYISAGQLQPNRSIACTKTFALP